LGQAEQGGLGFAEQAAADQAFQLGSDAFGAPWLRAGAECLADVLGAEPFGGLPDGGEDLVEAGCERCWW
jgi:hypothetical protein